MEITLYNFSKRENSTKTPVEEGVTKTVRLKEKCCLTNPSFFLTGSEQYNYCKAWGRYYFIDGIAWDINGAEYIHCTIDVLGTYKDQIKSTSAFVKYSSSDYSQFIIDDRVTPLVETHNTYSTAPSIFSPNSSLIITAIGQDGGVNNYYTGYSGLSNILTSLCAKTSQWYSSIFTGLSDALSALISVREVPIMNLPVQATGKHVYLGNFDLDIGDLQVLSDINAGLMSDVVNITIPRTYSDFRMGSRYTRLKLFLPFVGVISLSADDFLESEGIDIATEANALTGSVIYRIGNDQGVIATYTGTFGRQIPMANIQLTNVAQSLGTILQGTSTASAIMGIGGPGSISGGIGAAASLVSAGLKAFEQFNQESVQTIGGYSGGYGELIGNIFYLLLEEQPTRIEPSTLATLYGRPCSAVRRIGNLSGYVETIGFSIDLDALKEERNMVNTMMDSGVYLE